MTCVNDCISKVESEIQKALYETASLQADISKINVNERSKLNAVLEKEIKKYQTEKARYQNLQTAITVLTIVTAVLSVGVIGGAALGGLGIALGTTTGVTEFLGTSVMTFFQLGIPAGANLALAGATMAQGTIQTVAGSFGYEMADTKKDVDSLKAFSQYISDKNDDNSNKMKNTYSALSSLMKTFNELIGLYGQALQKVT